MHFLLVSFHGGKNYNMQAKDIMQSGCYEKKLRKTTNFFKAYTKGTYTYIDRKFVVGSSKNSQDNELQSEERDTKTTREYVAK